MILSWHPQSHFNFWYNWFTSFYYAISIALTSFYGGVVLIQIILISSIVAYILSEFYALFHSKWNNLLFIPFLFPSIIMLNLYPFRFQMYGMLFLFVLSLIVFKYISKKNLNFTDSIVCGILSSIIIFWRAESVFNILFIPILGIILFYKKENQHEKYIFTSVLRGIYDLTEINFKSDNKLRDLELMSNVFNWDIEHDFEFSLFDVEINKVSLEDINKIKKMYAKLFFLNFNKLVVFKWCKYRHCNEFLLSNEQGRQWEFVQKHVFPSKEVTPVPYNEKLRLNVCRFLDCVKKGNSFYDKTPYWHFFYNLLIPTIFVIFITVVGVVKRNRLLFVPLLVLIHTFITIMTSADGNMFYYFIPIYLFGWTFFPIFLLGWHETKNGLIRQ